MHDYDLVNCQLAQSKVSYKENFDYQHILSTSFIYDSLILSLNDCHLLTLSLN